MSYREIVGYLGFFVGAGVGVTVARAIGLPSILPIIVAFISGGALSYASERAYTAWKQQRRRAASYNDHSIVACGDPYCKWSGDPQGSPYCPHCGRPISKM